MGQAAQFVGDIQASGVVYAKAFKGIGGTGLLGDGDIAVPSTGANAVAANKVKHHHEKVISVNGDSTTTAATTRRALHVVQGGTATVVDFSVGAVTAALGAATVTVKLLKNGVDILTADTSLTSATAAFALLAA